MNIINQTKMELYDSDAKVDQLIRECDDTIMPLPDIEAQPHLLISKVRKHYMKYIIKLLSDNYEINQKLPNKNIYLPSAIWRCAKIIEMNAAYTSMMVQLYRKNIVPVINELKSDTKKGKMYRRLYECLRKPPDNEKKMQASFATNDCNCQCSCNLRKKRRKPSESSKAYAKEQESFGTAFEKLNRNNIQPVFSIPVIENLRVDSPQVAKEKDLTQTQAMLLEMNETIVAPLKPTTRLSIESQDSDELVLQMEKIFRDDSQEDDLFESFCDTFDTTMPEDGIKKITNEVPQPNQIQDAVIENHAAQIKSLDERVACIAGLLLGSNDNDSNHVPQEKPEIQKTNKLNSSKWPCEDYFLKTKLFEYLDNVGDSNRKKLARIRVLLINIFGEDSDYEAILSPLEETPEFKMSCQERIAPWVVKLLTPYYSKGRIRGKALFKAVAKHLIRLIYQCSRYPQEYEVHSFVTDFLKNHKVIRCEADFKQFKIDNL